MNCLSVLFRHGKYIKANVRLGSSLKVYRTQTNLIQIGKTSYDWNELKWIPDKKTGPTMPTLISLYKNEEWRRIPNIPSISSMGALLMALLILHPEHHVRNLFRPHLGINFTVVAAAPTVTATCFEVCNWRHTPLPSTSPPSLVDSCIDFFYSCIIIPFRFFSFSRMERPTENNCLWLIFGSLLFRLIFQRYFCDLFLYCRRSAPSPGHPSTRSALIIGVGTLGGGTADEDEERRAKERR